ncbi:helix-turn-helix domain-containing protein [Streptomyces sp. NPDC020884]|uniref:helix-turn-helix domain-containing protein n=1 Tax=Streptomyces sp. NPDC020884 TaxID=3365100 RepID=UPI00379F63F1
MGGAEGAARAALADRLNALREESGRTYASLARRIGVSGSTLHRYCTGRTVPAEFAPVERLARWCGAPPEEREALHRLWILADGERVERQGAAEAEQAGGLAVDAPTGGTGVVPVDAPSGETGALPVNAPHGETASPGELVRPRTAEAAAEPGPSEKPGPSADPGPPAHPGSTTEAGPPARPGPTTEPGQPARQGSSADPGPSAPPGPSGGETSRPVPSYVVGGPAPNGNGSVRRPVFRSRRARRYGQAIGVLAAAVLVLALVAAFAGTGLSGPDRSPSVAQHPGAPPADTQEPSPSGSLGSGKPHSTPSGTPRGTASGSPRAAGPPGVGSRQEVLPRASGPSPGPKAGRVPFTWTGDDHVWKNGCDHSYLVDRAPSAVPPPPVEADAASWAGALGAVHAGESGVRITLQGRDERTVVLEALRIRVVERRAPAKGRVYRMSSGCGGALTPRMFDVDLDVPRPLARSVAGNDSGEPIEAVAFPYTVSVSDPEVLLVTGRTVGCDCDWYAELAWSSGGRSGTVRIDDGGRPFRTSGAREDSVLDYDTGTGRWVSVQDAADAGGPGEAGTDGETAAS